jgi:hypothetical protein
MLLGNDSLLEVVFLGAALLSGIGLFLVNLPLFLLADIGLALFHSNAPPSWFGQSFLNNRANRVPNGAAQRFGR